MKKVSGVLINVSIGIFTYLLLGASCLPKTSFPVNGFLFGQKLEITVDSELAKLMLTQSGDSAVSTLFQTYEASLLDTRTLSEISSIYSADVATLYFLQRAYGMDKNKIAQDNYIKFFHQQIENEEPDLSILKEYHVVFIPGLAYREDTTTGADFARQRRLLNALGISNELVETEEWGLIEVNAEIIAHRLKSLSRHYDKIMLVSASKGGLETAIALGRILTPEEIEPVKSWISVGGILRGSPIADKYLTAPKCWFAEFMLWTKGKKIDLVRDMSYKTRSEEFDSLVFPDHLQIIHYVGAPLSNGISNEIKGRYCSMKELGPNDGLTPIADEITENGIIISELGLDHYYRDKDIDKKTLALALAAAE